MFRVMPFLYEYLDAPKALKILKILIASFLSFSTLATILKLNNFNFGWDFLKLKLEISILKFIVFFLIQ